MERDERDNPHPGEAPPVPFGRVVKLLAGAGAAVGLAALGDLALASTPAEAEPTWSVVLRLVLTVGGLITAGLAVSARPDDSRVLGLAFLVALAANFAVPAGWDSARLVVWVLTWLAGVAALVMLLSPPLRRLVVSAVLLFHFGGILSAVTSPPPQPYLTAQMWTRVFRPYLQFLYLNNAYHFYSPEPGPANQMWFLITYKDGTPAEWYDMPHRPDDIKDPLAISYYRRLALTEQTNQLLPPNAATPPGTRFLARGVNGEEIKGHPDLPLVLQYRPPVDQTRYYVIPSYVRHVARRFTGGHPERIATIRMYRVEHRILGPNELVQKISPYDPTRYSPYYLGEFDADGHIKNAEDPLLYWVVPIIREPKKGVVLPGGAELDPKNYEFKNYLTVQTGNDQNPAAEMIRAFEKASAR
jgi:hypothetical protein